MILVLNLNASVDKRYALADFAKGKVVRAKAVQNTAGGKGLHVANVAHALGADVVTSGFVGGKAGEFIEERMTAKGLRGNFTHVAGETRSCLAILTDDGAQTEILEPGPTVTASELADFLHGREDRVDGEMVDRVRDLELRKLMTAFSVSVRCS